jgi:tripartite ATP-independent transporter DctM subunit
MIIVLAMVLLVLLLVLGVPIPFAFLGSTLMLIVALGYDPSFLLPFGYSKMSTIVILAIPLFIIAGGLINRAHVGDKLVDLVEIFVGRIKGGLGAIGIVSCAVFGSITGSACATLSAIGSIMFPKLEAAGYPKGHSAAIMSSASVLGMLIPPSSIMILYAWVGQTSVLACFLSSVIPGIILTIMLCLVNVFLLRGDKNIKIAPPLARGQLGRELRRRSWSGLPAMTMPVLVLGGIYGGFVTPTEAAALSVLYVLPLGFLIYRGLTWRGVFEVFKESVATTGSIMLMLYCIMILSRIYIMEDLPGLILDRLTSVSDNKYAIMLMLNLFMILIGMLMDDVSAVLLVTPLLVPVVVKLGVHPVHFAAIVGVNLGLGNITPPTAPLLYLSTQLNGASVGETIPPTLWLILLAWLPALAVTTSFPALSLWLPRLLLGGTY